VLVRVALDAFDLAGQLADRLADFVELPSPLGHTLTPEMRRRAAAPLAFVFNFG
jgi:hypothetical protein